MIPRETGYIGEVDTWDIITKEKTVGPSPIQQAERMEVKTLLNDEVDPSIGTIYQMNLDTLVNLNWGAVTDDESAPSPNETKGRGRRSPDIGLGGCSTFAWAIRVANRCGGVVDLWSVVSRVGGCARSNTFDARLTMGVCSEKRVFDIFGDFGQNTVYDVG